MLIGVPKEIKNHEYRVGLTPSSVNELVKRGHKVIVERMAGLAIDFTDAEYSQAGAEMVDSAGEVFSRADMIVKVKEPQPNEWVQLRPGQLLFTYLHLAPDPEQAKGLIVSGCTAIAYETVTDDRGTLPWLAPMSEVAGRLAIEAAGQAMRRSEGGAGILLGGVLGQSAECFSFFFKHVNQTKHFVLNINLADCAIPYAHYRFPESKMTSQLFSRHPCLIWANHTAINRAPSSPFAPKATHHTCHRCLCQPKQSLFVPKQQK